MTKHADLKEKDVGAVISDCGLFRYWLSRSGENLLSRYTFPAVFVMLNPSVADASQDDPTVRRGCGFAANWGYNGLIVVNLYAFRATNPKDLWNCDDPVGPENDEWLERVCSLHESVVCAWGNNARQDRVGKFKAIAKKTGTRLLCLGTTKSGAPRHPLYIKADQPLEEWK